MLNCCYMFLDRVRGEYDEMPDLKLTMWQACRLWNLDAELCEDIFATLVSEGFLLQTAGGAYLRRSGHRHRSICASGPDWLPAGPAEDGARTEEDESGDDDPVLERPDDGPVTPLEAEPVGLGV